MRQAGEPPQFYLSIVSTVKPDKRCLRRFVRLRRKLALVAKRLQWNQSAFCSSLTGGVTQFLEVYEYQGGTEAVLTAQQQLENEPLFQEAGQLCLERKPDLLSRLPYVQKPPPPRCSVDTGYLLHVRLTLPEGDLARFSAEMQKVVVPTFEEKAHCQLVAGGSTLGRSDSVMNLWLLEDANALDRLMLMLADDPDYHWINEHTVQHQNLMHGIAPRPPSSSGLLEGSP
jgi:hypothetical protein